MSMFDGLLVQFINCFGGNTANDVLTQNNNNIKKSCGTITQQLVVDLNALTVEDRGWYDGLRRNSSIKAVKLFGNILNNHNFIIDGVLHEILKVYQENSSHLTTISIRFCNLVNGGDGAIATTLRGCTNLKDIDLSRCGINDEQILPIVEGLRGHGALEKLRLFDNRIGAAGCQSLTTLLEDHSSNIGELNLQENQIGIDGAMTLFNSLLTNSRLRNLYLGGNPTADFRTVDALSRVLCNTTSINSTYTSNHTLEFLAIRHSNVEIDLLLDLNKDTNKSRVAMKKILKYHPNIDMEPLFHWDAEEGEQNLKALPHVISWFDKACWAVLYNDDKYNIEEKKLSAIFQFAKAMPLLFVPTSHIKKDDNKKRKRECL